MRILDANTGEILVDLGYNWNFPAAAYWSPDGTMIATPGGVDGPYLNIWSHEGERLDTYWAGNSAAWSPHSSHLATTGQVRDVTTGLPTLIIPNMEYLITWHPDGEWLTSANDEGKIFLWDAETGDLVTTWSFDDCIINGFTWSSDGQRFALNCIQFHPNYQNDLIIAEVVY
jgi:WD40 repeat protein